MKQFKVKYRQGFGSQFIVHAENEDMAKRMGLAEFRRNGAMSIDEWSADQVIESVEETDGTLPENPSYPTVPPYMKAKDIVKDIIQHSKEVADEALTNA